MQIIYFVCDYWITIARREVVDTQEEVGIKSTYFNNTSCESRSPRLGRFQL